MPLESSHSTKKPLPPNPCSPQLSFSEATTSPSVTTTRTWPDSPYTGLGQNDRSFTDSELHSNTSVGDATTPPLSTRLTYPLSPPQTPDRPSTSPKPEARTLALDLPKLPELFESPPSQPLPEEHSIQITECPSRLSVVEATTSKSVASNTVSPESSSSTSSVQSDPEESPSTSSDSPATERSFLFKFPILASKHRHRAQARDTRIKNVIRLLKQVRDGTYSGPQLLIRRKLNPSEYQDLLDRIEADKELDGFFNDKLRFEYSYVQKQFTIQMPSGVHSAFVSDVEYKIRNFLEEHASLTNESIIAKIARDMKAMGDGEISPPEPKYGGKGPDASFQLRGCDYPGLIIEVAWSQDKSELEEKAKYYLESTEGEVRTVICFNLHNIFNEQKAAEKQWARDKERRKNKSDLSSFSGPLTFLAPAAAATCASFSVWRAEEGTIGKDSVHDQIFRCANQQHNSDVSLVLSLKDFLCEAVVRKLCTEEGRLETIDYPQLEIPSKMLCDWFEGAVQTYRPQWERNLKRAAHRKQEKKDAKAAKLGKEAAELKKEEAGKSAGRRRHQILDAMRRVLRSGSYKQPEEI